MRNIDEALNSCITVPSLQVDCNWSPAYATEKDDVHLLKRACEEVDFMIDYDNNAIIATMSGGVSPFGFGWTGPENFQYTQTGEYSKIFPTFTGEYCVKIVDAAGCLAEDCILYCGDWFSNLIAGMTEGNFIDISPICPDGTGGEICLPLNRLCGYYSMDRWPYE